MIKNPFCRPRLRPAVAAKSRRLSPMSVLDRLREAVFRFIMLSALSNDRRRRSPPSPSDRYYYPGEAHHSEAVADCIEFIKKSSTARGEGRDSTASCGYGESTAAVAFHLPNK